MKKKVYKEKKNTKFHKSSDRKSDKAPVKSGVTHSVDEARKQKIIDLLKDDIYVPMKEKELAIVMQVSDADRVAFNKALQELVLESRITISKRGKYTISDGSNITGVFTSHSSGYGFVTVEGRKEDYFIPKSKTGGAFHGDTVIIRPLFGRRGERTEAEITNIVSHNTETAVGIFQRLKGFGFVICDDRHIPDIFISEEKFNKAKDGQVVVVKITSYGGDGRKPEGEITEVLGEVTDSGIDVMSIIRGFGIPEVFDKEVMAASEQIPEEVIIPEDENREDLRDLYTVTIDGTDTKDIDDAVSLEIKDGDYILGVHIADVSEYVHEGDVLDREALKRGTSVYFADRVIPMLPVRLSNGICSLNEKVDRLAMSCIMRFDRSGSLKDYRIAETIIHVDENMNYPSVLKILNGDESEQALHEKATPMLLKMNELAHTLRARRRDRGSVDFDTRESKFELDENGTPVNIYARVADDATMLIEDFMLAANETVASHMFWQDKPFLYRIHEKPDEDKIQSLSILVKNFGFYIKGEKGDLHPKELQRLLNEFKGRSEEPVISRLALRSMQQARYSPECEGHFGLALKYYTHFTSPIRRYPDLQIHRILKEDLRGQLNEKRIGHYSYILEDVAKRSSKAERRADEAEREVEKLKKAKYMENHIGEIYDGTISGVTSFGIYVELENTVEGLVHISKIPGDYFEYDEKHLVIYGIHSGIKYTLGESVKVKAVAVDTHLKTIDFDLIME